MNVSFYKDSVFINLMKTNKNKQICGEYNKENQTYTGKLDGRKVTIVLVASLVFVAAAIVTIVFSAGIGVLAGMGLSLGIMGAGYGSLLMSTLALCSLSLSKPLPHKEQLEDEFARSMEELKEIDDKNQDQLEADYKGSDSVIKEHFEENESLIN